MIIDDAEAAQIASSFFDFRASQYWRREGYRATWTPEQQAELKRILTQTYPSDIAMLDAAAAYLQAIEDSWRPLPDPEEEWYRSHPNGHAIKAMHKKYPQQRKSA